MDKKELKESIKKEFENLNYKNGKKKIQKMDVSKDIKETMLEMFELWWDYRNWTPESEGFDWKAAEGVGSCLMIMMLKYDKKVSVDKNKVIKSEPNMIKENFSKK
jgi:hypothetical protein